MKSAGNGSARHAVTRRKKDSYEKTAHSYLFKDCGGFAHCFGGTKDKVRSFVPPIFRVDLNKIERALIKKLTLFLI
ncbi:hypothetical protein J2S74_001776 [Evansella vedderi]|uniref:Uncharacterized protein n=1 Tax=Evansella vedderi TaxID=38282 RepID=A0ABT9ZT32_9BACI|nr:hypothetical protein [Evansella vedderi]MDQ0254401.1 hypothetical protein [Evansella vedderi]